MVREEVSDVLGQAGVTAFGLGTDRVKVHEPRLEKRPGHRLSVSFIRWFSSILSSSVLRMATILRCIGVCSGAGNARKSSWAKPRFVVPVACARQ